MGRVGLEPTVCNIRLKAGCARHLATYPISAQGGDAFCRIRTYDTEGRNLVLYSTELRRQIFQFSRFGVETLTNVLILGS